MDNPNRLKQRVFRMFRSSFGSCSSRNIDIIEKAVVVPQPRKNHPSNDSKSPKPRPYPSIHEPGKNPSLRNINNPCFVPNKSSQQVLFSPYPICPPATPSSRFYEINVSGYEEKLKKSAENKEKSEKNRLLLSSSSQETSFENWFSSDDEREDETESFFSSKSTLSVSSDSSDSHRSRRRKQSINRKRFQRRIKAVVSENNNGTMNDSCAVVKKSCDPYSDFRTSMVEMIVEKELFSEEELEGLLHCFLSLNSEHHHEVIVEVFTEIWNALFCSSKQ